jgi:DNA-binding beta-propeller fold protein YncE
MTKGAWKFVAAPAAVVVPLLLLANAGAQSPSAGPLFSGAGAAPIIAPSHEVTNVYAEAGAGMLSPPAAAALHRVYVPVVHENRVYVIDPETMKVIDRFAVPGNPQHVVPSWDLKTLWVASSAPGRKKSAAVTPIDPMTGKPGKPVVLPDAYNLYFMPNGSAAIVVAEAMSSLEFRDPGTMALISTLRIPECSGINHADFSPDGTVAIFTCEFGGGGLVKVDLVARSVVATLKFARQSMPQDIRSSPDGTVFFVADMMSDGLHVIDVAEFKEVTFIPTGIGAHALYPSRDGTKLYVANRGSHSMGSGGPRGPGSVSVLDFATRTIEATWPIPGGGSPDMGNVSADGQTLWLSGRYDDVAYAIDTASGAVTKVPVGSEPHGLTVWPQPGRYSLGHTGVMR